MLEQMFKLKSSNNGYYDVLAEQMLVIIYGVIDKEHSLTWLATFAKKFSGEE